MLRALFQGRKPEVGGFIASAGLEEWWLHDFDAEERATIDRVYRPMGTKPEVASVLTFGPKMDRVSDPAKTLSNAATWFTKEDQRTIAYRFIDKANQLLILSEDPLTAHFHHAAEGKIFYRWRDMDSFAFARACAAFERQVAMSKEASDAFKKDKIWGGVPSHFGFKQLAIIAQKDGRLQDACEYCERAQSEGWSGDWEKRLARLRARLAR